MKMQSKTACNNKKEKPKKVLDKELVKNTEPEDMAPSVKFKFKEDEKVLCFHGPLMYEAKVLRRAVSKQNFVKYFIHYAGWNKKWDEWVPESRVLKYNDANLQRLKEVQKAHAAQPAKPNKCPEPTTPSTRAALKSAANSDTQRSASPDDEPSRKKRRGVDPSVETEEQYLAKLEVRIKIPEELKVWIADDWDVITRQHKLANLPARITVEKILDNYLTSKKASKANTQAKEVVLTDVVYGIKEYFNAILGCQLLYKFEWPQHKEIIAKHPNASMSELYGAIHLLRLFVRLGPMLAYTAIDEKSLQQVLLQIQDFLKYLVVNRASLLNLKDYNSSAREYQNSVS